MTSTAMGQRVDIEKLRAAIRHMSRGNLLSIANRGTELVPRPRLGSLVAGRVRLDLLSEGTRDAVSLLEEVRTFRDACLRGVWLPKTQSELETRKSCLHADTL